LAYKHKRTSENPNFSCPGSSTLVAVC
jgi:hypothetical protein